MEIISGYVEVHVFRRSFDEVEYLLLKRAREQKVYPGLWQVVTGKIKPNEKAYETALRELKEETGFSPLRLWATPKVNQFYSAEKDAVYIVPVFAAEVNNTDEIVLCREHCKFRWMKPEDARNLLPWEEQRNALDTLMYYLLKRPDNLDLVEILLPDK
jgi:dihydroneopterin triphosphate diphosphatase